MTFGRKPSARPHLRGLNITTSGARTGVSMSMDGRGVRLDLALGARLPVDDLTADLRDLQEQWEAIVRAADQL